MRPSRYFRKICLGVFLLMNFPAWCGQFMGGELSYRFISRNGNEYVYEITFKLYRECLNLAELKDPVIRIINSVDLSQNNHPVIYREETLDNPVISLLPHTKKNYCAVNDPSDCIELRIYKRIVSLPYSAEGYSFYYSGCCRNGMSNLQLHSWNDGVEWINGTVPQAGQGLTYVVRMPSHDSIPENSSPVSLRDSVISACSGKPLEYYLDFFDADGDSLVYRTTHSLAKTDVANTYSDPVFFVNGFDAAHPLKGAPRVVIDSITGRLHGTPDATGRFAVVVLVEEYRDGKLIGIGRKDFQVNVFDCEIQEVESVSNCNSNIAQFLNRNNATNSFHWDFGVPVIANDTSNIHQPIYAYPQSGVFPVKLVVTNPGGCKDSVFTTATIFPEGLLVDFDWIGGTCTGEELIFTDRTLFPAGNVTKWSWKVINTRVTVGSGNPFPYTPRPFGTMPFPLAMQLTVETDIGCKDSIVKDILIYDNVVADAGPDRILAFGQPYKMQGNSTTGVLYNWTPSLGLDDPSAQFPVVSADRDITYQLTVTNEAGCTEIDQVSFKYMKGPAIYVATAFTPNGDGLNDVLHFYPVAMDVAELMIFNRWGERLFSSKDFSKGWDGKVNGIVQPSGIFVWMVKAKDLNGKDLVEKGTVMLIRK